MARASAWSCIWLFVISYGCLVCAQPLTAPQLKADQLAKCATLEGLTQLAASLPEAKAAAKDQDASTVGTAAYYWIWGYPLPNMARLALSTGIKTGAINKLVGIPVVITPANQDKLAIVTPNTDTLYQSGWLDLSKGPIAVYTPDSKGRYYMVQLLDFWTNVIGSPGSPTTGTGANKYVVLPPGYKKESLPAEYQKYPMYQSNTTAVMVVARQYAGGNNNPPTAQQVQAATGLNLVNPASASADTLRTAVTNANALLDAGDWTIRTVRNATAAFVAIAGLAKAFPGAAYTAGPAQLASKLGLQPAKGFEQPQIGAQQEAALRAGFVVGQACINAYALSDTIGVAQPTGWTYTTKAGLFVSDYLLRAAVAYIGLAANTPEVTIYGLNSVDDKKQKLSGASDATYTITFATIPPAKDFASLTAYSTKTNMLMANPNSDRPNIDFKATPGLQFEEDGSLTLYLSAKPPGVKGSKEYANWLPIAEEPFYAVLRVYGPSQALIDGKIPLPAFVKVK